MSKCYGTKTVWDAALDRIRYLFDEFPNVVVNFSGGKDSTVTLQLALIVAEEKGRLPLNVLFLDQEAEWETVIDYIREVMSDPRINPMWLQVPFKIFNATSTTEPWLVCWEPGKEDEWIRPKEPNSIHVNRYGTDRFAELFNRVCEVEFGNTPTAKLAGVRCEESPGRYQGLTKLVTYKWLTWGRVENKKLGHYTFYPLYDWTFQDVWKAIHDNNWPYCDIYNYQYQYGIPVREMRVSNLHHESAVNTLFYLQEIEQDTWNRVTHRLSGINTAGKMQEQFFMKELPFMFESWKEYRDYLLEALIDDPEIKERFTRQFAAYDRNYVDEIQEKLGKVQVQCILTNDYHGTKLDTWRAGNGKYSKRHGSKDDGKYDNPTGLTAAWTGS